MARVLVLAADRTGEELARLQVRLGALPPRVIDRATALRWLRDQHSFIPWVGGKPGPALQLVTLDGDDGAASFIRTDASSVAADHLPELPAVRA